jgi:hypothetical protein
MISIEGTKILCLKTFNAVLKYEAESAIHAQDWVSAINKYKNPQSYEKPLNLKKDSLTLDQVEMSEKPTEILQKQFPPPPDATPAVPVQSKDEKKNLIHEMTGKINLKKSTNKQNIEENSSKAKSANANNISSIIVNSSKNKQTSNDDIYHTIDSIPIQETVDHLTYENTDFHEHIENWESLYLCIYKTNGNSHVLNLKVGDIIQLVQKISDDIFIGKCFGIGKTVFGLVNFNYVVKIYNNNNINN